MCDNRSSTKYNFFKVIFVAEFALPTRQPCTISLSLNAASAAVSIGQISLKLLPSPSSTALAKPCFLRMSASVLWWHNLHHLHGYINCFTVSFLHHTAVRSWESLVVTRTVPATCSSLWSAQFLIQHVGFLSLSTFYVTSDFFLFDGDLRNTRFSHTLNQWFPNCVTRNFLGRKVITKLLWAYSDPVVPKMCSTGSKWSAISSHRIRGYISITAALKFTYFLN